MLETFATLALGAAMTAFAIFAVMLNEGERSARLLRHRGRRRRSVEGHAETGQRRASSPIFSASDVLPGTEPLSSAAPSSPGDPRRLPVGDFLFGALFLTGATPLAFADLARTAGESGLDVSQVLNWLARAEQSGLVERVHVASLEGEESGHPAVRLTPAGMDRAQNNRRTADRGELTAGTDQLLRDAR